MYVDNESYKDEWIVCTYDNAILLAIADEDGGNRHKYFSDTMKYFQTEKNAMVSVVSTNLYSACPVSTMTEYLQKNEIFVIHTHGTQTSFKLSETEYYNMNDLKGVDLSNINFALLLTCETGVGFDPMNIENNTPVNIIEQMVICGARTVVGFNETTWVSDCNKFAPELTRKIMIEGMGVQEAIEDIDYTFYGKNMMNIAEVAGDVNNQIH